MSLDFNRSLKKFLLVDDDPEFIAYFLSLTEPYNLAFDVCQTLQIAQQKIRSFQYDAYIVDLNLSDGSGIDLIQEIRQKGDQSPIAVISGIFQDEQTFKMLKENYAVDFILDKPIYPLQLDQLLVQLCPQKQLPKTPNKLDELNKQYVKTVSDKIILLKELIKTVQDKPEPNCLTALKSAVHKIAGSAGSYGFIDVSVLCKELEFQIDQRLSSKETIEQGWLDSLTEFLRKIKFSFQFPAITESQGEAFIAFPITRPSLYVIDNDPKFLELLQREKEEFDIDLYVDSNPEKALSRLKLPEFNPRIIVSSQTFAGSDLTAFDLLEAVKKKQETTSTMFALILTKDDIDVRMQALQKGVKYIFNKPISPSMLLEPMTKALELGSLRNFKALIIDDDPDVCNFISSALAEIGIEIRSIEHPSAFYKVLEEFSPDLLFMDIVLPKFDGLNLLKTLRADAVYQNLFVVVITEKGEGDTQFGYEEDADDILYKPLSKQMLQKCVRNAAKRVVLTQSSIQKRIGLQTAKALLVRLREILTSPSHISSYLVLFRIDHYADLVMQHGQNAINELMVSISNLLHRMEDNTIVCYCIDASTFAILFNGYDGSVVEKRTFELLDSVQSQSNLNINLICSIVVVSKDLGNNQTIIRAAESGLKEALSKPLSSIRIATPSIEGMAPKKILVLIEPNEDLLHILQKAFDAYNLIIKAFKEGKPALQELLSGDAAQQPALVIAERKLPDMDGIEILKSLQARYKVPTPFYFLTDFVAEKDISEGLKHGALEYITKPFNLSLLVQKSAQVIFEGKR